MVANSSQISHRLTHTLSHRHANQKQVRFCKCRSPVFTNKEPWNQLSVAVVSIVVVGG